LLPVHTAIVQTLQESHRQNQELRQAVLFMEQQRQASEVQRRAEDALKREQMAVMFQQGFGRAATAAESAAASAQRAYEMSQSVGQQYLLALQAAKRRERSPINIIVSGGGGPPPPPPPGAAPLEMVPAQPPNRMALVPVENPQVKRAASRAASEEQAKRPADELAKREPRAVARLAIAAASGSASGPERPDEVPASSSAGPEYKRPERVAPYAAANRVAVESRAVRKLRAAGFDVPARSGGVNAGAALAGALDTSGGRPTVPNLREAGARASSATGRFFGGKAHRLASDPPTRRLRGKTPVAPNRARSRSAARITDKDI
jgi:hypothetical protein